MAFTWKSVHPAIVFYAVTLAYSWSLWLLMILSAEGLLPFHFPTNFLGSFGPAVGAIVAALVLGGRPKVRELLRPLFRWKVSPGWYALTLLGPAFFYCLAIVFLSVWKGLPQIGDLKEWYLVFPLALLLLIVGGPLGEEIGWRGFLLPCLLQQKSSLPASLIIAVLWFVWHIPLFWLQGAAQEGSSILGFALFFLSLTIIFTWLYHRTKRNLWMAVLLHTGINTASYCLPAVLPVEDQEKWVQYIFLGICSALALLILIRYGRDLGAAPDKNEVTAGSSLEKCP